MEAGRAWRNEARAADATGARSPRHPRQPVHACHRFQQLQPAGRPLTCAPPLMELEGRVLTALGATTRYRIDGDRLTLLAGDQVLARLEAV